MDGSIFPKSAYNYVMKTNLTTNLSINIAKDEYGKNLVIDIGALGNLFIAGVMGSGKSTLLHNILGTLIANVDPGALKFVLIDPKRIELSVYNRVPHLLTPVITDPKKAVLALKWSGKEMDRRLGVLRDSGCKDVSAYHRDISEPVKKELEKPGRAPDDTDAAFYTRTIPETMPHIVIVIDDLSNLMQTYPKETISAILRVAEAGRSAGIHFVVTSTRVSSQIFGKELQSAMNARIALQIAGAADSRLVIGTRDACELHGPGDMLFRDGKKFVIRAQVNMFTYEEAKSIANTISEKFKDDISDSINFGSSTAGAATAFDAMKEYEDENDDMYEPARELVIRRNAASTSLIQRGLGIGYSRAAKLMEMLEERGVIGPANGSKPREVMGVKQS